MICEDRGIYRITCPCNAAYTGRSTTSFAKRFKEYFKDNLPIHEHVKGCPTGNRKRDIKSLLLENFSNRGVPTLSEREY